MADPRASGLGAALTQRPIIHLSRRQTQETQTERRREREQKNQSNTYQRGFRMLATRGKKKKKAELDRNGCYTRFISKHEINIFYSSLNKHNYEFVVQVCMDQWSQWSCVHHYTESLWVQSALSVQHHEWWLIGRCSIYLKQYFHNYRNNNGETKEEAFSTGRLLVPD